ncbi:MAG: hypothetical protein AB7D28_08790 [Candidatus Berkiella sp.]
MTLRRDPDGTLNLRLYLDPTNPKIFRYSDFIKDYDYEAFITATESERKKIDIFFQKNAKGLAESMYNGAMTAFRGRLAREQQIAQSSSLLPSSDPVEQLASTVEKLSLGTEAKYTAEDAERFLIILKAGGQGVAELPLADKQKFVYWKMDYLQTLIDKQKKLEAEGLELSRRRDFLLMQTGQKILAEIAEQDHSTSNVPDSNPTKKISLQ